MKQSSASSEEAVHRPLIENAATLLLYIFCALFIFLPKISQGYVLAPEDNMVQNFPNFACRDGLWTPLLLSGFPLLADPQTQFFYPIARLLKFLPLATPLAFNIYVIVAFVLSAFFTALLTRRLSGSFYGGVIAGLSFGFSGYLISELKHIQVLHTALWLPLLFYCLELARAHATNKARSLLSLVAIALVVGILLFAGHPQTAFCILLAAAIYAPVICLSKKNSRTDIICLVLIYVAIALGIFLAAAQILPSWELSGFSARSSFTFKDMLVGQVEPMQLIGFSMPYLLGGAYGTIGGLPFAEQGAPPGLMFFGFAPLILAGLALFQSPKDKRIVFFAALSLLAFLLALGSLTPLANIFYFFPLFAKFRGLYRVLVLSAFGLAVLSACGLRYLEQKNQSRLLWQNLGLLRHFYLCVYLLLSAICYVFFLGTMPILLFIFRNRLSEFLIRLNTTSLQKILVITVSGVMATYACNAEWLRSSPRAEELSAPTSATTLGEDLRSKNYRCLTVAGIDAGRDQLPPNLSRLWNVPSATGYEPLISSRYAHLLNLAEGGFMQPPWHITGASRVLDMTSVKYLIASQSDFGPKAFDRDAAQNWLAMPDKLGITYYENKKALPRFYLVSQARHLSDIEILAAMRRSKFADGTIFDPTRIVLLESPAAEIAAGADKSRAIDNEAVGNEKLDAQISDEKLIFKTESPTAKYLVVTDSYYPGWQATIDGRPTTIERANYVQRACFVPAGRHEVVMTFAPQAVITGGLISGAIAVLLILLFCTGLSMLIREKSKKIVQV